jgi:GNAT superfamily N-acetyltransferase
VGPTRDNRPVTIDDPPGTNGTVGPTPTRPAFVRPAGPGDEALLQELSVRALGHMAPSRGGAMYLERHATPLPPLPADWSAADRRVWLGGLDNAEAGYLVAAIAPLASGGVVGVIEAIYVEPDARCCGIGEAMMDVAIGWLRGRGCVGVEATALPGERATKNFFEEHGLKARLLTVYRSLSDDDPLEQPLP